jgi:hypothetical protein
MRAFPALVLAIAGAALWTGTLAQDRDGMDRNGVPLAPAPSDTTGAGTGEPALQAPIGHRQPRAANAPSGETNGAPVSPYDQQIDRNLDICRGC